MNEGANAAYESAMLPLEVSKDASPFNLKRELNFSAAPNNQSRDDVTWAKTPLTPFTPVRPIEEEEKLFEGNHCSDLTNKLPSADQSVNTVLEAMDSVFLVNEERCCKGDALVERIRTARRGAVIEVEGEHIMVRQHLYLHKAITLVGSPGTVLEFINGSSIIVDFGTNATHDLSETLIRVGQHRGTSSLSLKRSEVAVISECDLVFNRSSVCLAPQPKKENPFGAAKVHPSGALLNNSLGKSIDRKRNSLETSNFIGLVRLESDSFLELRDCKIQS